MDVGFDAANSAIMDTGAMSSMLNVDSVNSNSFLPYLSEATDITFGQGMKSRSQSSVDIGSFKAYVVPDLLDNLFSVDDAIDAGSVVMLNAKGGVIYNHENHSTIRVYRNANTWKVWQADIQDYVMPTGPLSVLLQDEEVGTDRKEEVGVRRVVW